MNVSGLKVEVVKWIYHFRNKTCTRNFINNPNAFTNRDITKILKPIRIMICYDSHGNYQQYDLCDFILKEFKLWVSIQIPIFFSFVALIFNYSMFLFENIVLGTSYDVDVSFM